MRSMLTHVNTWPDPFACSSIPTLRHEPLKEPLTHHKTNSVRLNYALPERKRLDCMAASARVRASLRQSAAERNELLALTEEARRLQAARAERARRARLARQRIARCETRCAIS